MPEQPTDPRPRDAAYAQQPQQSVVAHAPAKVNLTLSVLGRRTDGFHELRSTFLCVGLYDTITLRRRDDSRISLNVLGAGPDVTAGPENLVVRAAEQLRQSSGCPFGVEIELRKRIPSQAGLGGGSSDAVATLLALRRLWGLTTSDDDLSDICASLGSDLHFFLSRSPLAEVSGRGEIVTPVPLPRSFSAVIVKPPFGASTGRIFDELRASLVSTTSSVTRTVCANDLLSGVAPLHNDLLRPLVAAEPQFALWYSALESATSSSPATRAGWALTGSGTAMFQLARTAPEARSLAGRVRAVFPDAAVFVVGPGRLSIESRE